MKTHGSQLEAHNYKLLELTPSRHLTSSRSLAYIFLRCWCRLSITKIELCDGVWSISLLKEIKNYMKSRSQPHFHLFFFSPHTTTQAQCGRNHEQAGSFLYMCTSPCHATCHISKNILLHKSPQQQLEVFLLSKRF